MRIILTILFNVALTGISFAQIETRDSFILIRTITGDIADAAMDNFDNLYIVSSKGQIKKFNAAGDSAGIYNQVRNFGKVFTLDVSNPLKILLFYKDFSTVVVLDRFLASQSILDLRKFSILNPSAIGNSYDNNIWVFDEYDNKLKKIDEQGNKLLETADFRIAFNQSLSPQKIINDNGLVYLADSSNGVFVFDNYGSFKRKLPLRNWQTISIANNYVISSNSQSITFFNTSTQLQHQKNIPFFKPYLRSSVTPTRFINFSSDTVHIYQYHY